MITSPEKVRREGNLNTTIIDEQILPAIEKASIELKRLLGDLYNQVQNETNTQRRNEIEKAESLLALSYLVWTLNIETSGSGIVKAKGFGESRSELESWVEIEMLSNRFRNEALQILKPYITESVGIASGIKFIAI